MGPAKSPAFLLSLRAWLAGVVFGLSGAVLAAAEPASVTAAPAGPVATPTEPPVESLFKDSEDGHFDLTNFILSKRGFLAIPIVITEPAVGYGGGAALLFMKYAPPPPPGAPPPKRYVPPTITAVAGGLTENGTWFGGLIHIGVWQEDNLRYLGALARAHAVLKYYGNGGEGAGLNYETDAWMFLQQLQKRLGDTNWFYGAKYLYIGPDTTFSIGNGSVPGLQPIEFNSATAGAGGMISYDSRNNNFTPTKGVKTEWFAGYYDDALGGDFSYWRVDAFNVFFWELAPKLSLGLRVEGHFTPGDGRVPFYHQPSINLRGVPAARFQGRHTLVTELELDWSVSPRWTLVVFGGDGRVSAEDFDDLADADDVFSYGAGFRYTLARKLGIKGGLDFAWSKEDSGIYITVGSAWPR